MANKPTDDVHDKIAALPAFVDVAIRLHDVIIEAGPQLQPRLWYGMPGYAMSKNGPVLCFFRVDDERYVTFGLSEHAHHEPDGASGHKLMPSAWFLTELDAPTETHVADIVRRAIA